MDMVGARRAQAQINDLTEEVDRLRKSGPRFDADVLIYDRIGVKPYDGETVRSVGLGGSEIMVVQIAEGLAARGHRVVVASGVEDENDVAGVRYVPHSWHEG